MTFKIVVRENFRKQAKRLAKRYRSFVADLSDLVSAIKENPNLGTPLGSNVYKIRLAITSKNKGKSGGARVISYAYLAGETVFLLAVYDKSELDNISDSELKELVDEIESEF